MLKFYPVSCVWNLFIYLNNNFVMKLNFIQTVLDIFLLTCNIEKLYLSVSYNNQDNILNKNERLRDSSYYMPIIFHAHLFMSH